MALNKEDNLTNFISSITNLTTEYTKLYPQDKKDIWSILLNYLQNESANGKGDTLNAAIGHDGFRQSDIKNSSVWKIVDSYADLDREQSETLEWFNTLYEETKEAMESYWSSTYYTVYPSDVTRENSLWNDSLEYFLKYFYQYLDPEGVAAYESSGFLVENDDKIINTDYLRASIPVSGGVGMRVTDVKNADAGFYFVKESEIYSNVYIEALETTLKIVLRPWVIPWYNVNGHTYSGVRNDDKNIGVLANDEHLQFTRERYGDSYVTRIDTSTYTNGHLDGDVEPNTTSKNPYIRLIMPEYKRRVEIEDLDRNFWVIAQVITAISAYLFDDDSPIKKMFKELLNEVMQLWENVLYLWAAIAGLGSEPYYTDVHTEVIYLPNSEEQSYLKYDNFVRSDSSNDFFEYDYSNTYRIKNMNQNTLESILQERFRYLIQTYTESNLCIIPVLRINNYVHNYYSCEEYPCVMLYNRNEKNASANGGEQDYAYEIYWFNDPIFIDLSPSSSDSNTYWTRIYAVHEDENEYYFKQMFNPSTVIFTDDEVLFNCAIRTTPKVNCAFDSNNNAFYAYNSDSSKCFSFSLELSDLAGTLNKKNESKITITVKPNSNFGSLFTTNTITSPNWDITTSGSWSEGTDSTSVSSMDIERGFYLGEMPSYYVISSGIDWTPEITTVILVPYYTMTISVDSSYNTIISYTSTLDECKTESAEVIKKYIEEQQNVGQQKIYFYIGEHLYDCGVDEDDDTICYYLTSSGELATKNRKGVASQNVNLSATLFIPALDFQKTYVDFITYSGYGDYTGLDSNGNLVPVYSLLNDIDTASLLYLRTYDVYYKASDKKIKSDNWIIKVTYIYAMGSNPAQDYRDAARYSEFFNTAIDFKNSDYGPVAPIIRVTVHYFTPKGMYQKMLLRQSASSFKELTEFTVKDVSIDLSKYETYPLTSGGTQARKGVWGDVAPVVTYDFEKYPGNGLTL